MLLVSLACKMSLVISTINSTEFKPKNGWATRFLSIEVQAPKAVDMYIYIILYYITYQNMYDWDDATGIFNMNAG